METLVRALIAATATWQAVEVWRHGSLFASWRADVESSWRTGIRGFLGDLLGCPFCLSVWLGWITWVLTMTDWTCWLVAGLAVSRLANLANDVTHAISRTPKSTIPAKPTHDDENAFLVGSGDEESEAPDL